jgi:hypothetical protein
MRLVPVMRAKRLIDPDASLSGRLGFGLAGLLALLAFLPAHAIGQVAEPGNSATDQYTETYPTTGGGTPTGGVRGQTPKKALGSPDAERLEALGADGRAAAELAAATTPAAGSPNGNRVAGETNPAGAHSAGTENTDRAHGSSALDEIGSTGVSSSGEMGVLWPLVGIFALATAAAFLWHRRRQPT